METKAREFWVDYIKGHVRYNCTRDEEIIYDGEKIKVIEKSAYEKLEAEIKRLQSCCKDFEFVIEGSRAIKQPDSMLEKRENALMRALDWSNKKKALGGVGE